MIAWLKGWWETFLIWAFNRDLYHHLTQPFDPDDYVEVHRPEER